jgi:hypothetical protein
MESRRAGAVALGFSLAGVVLVVLFLGVAAGVGPSGLTHGTPHDPVFHTPTPRPTSASPSTSGVAGPAQLPHGHSDLPAAALIGLAVRIALVVWLLWLALRVVAWLRGVLDARRRHEPKPVQVDFEVLEDPEPLVEEIRRDADLQLELLLAGEPRNAIVACWERFEEQAERVGLARLSWETSAEFTLRLLDAVSADPVAVSDLAALYREARFSEHPITEAAREQAMAALQRVRDTVGSRPTTGPVTR